MIETIAKNIIESIHLLHLSSGCILEFGNALSGASELSDCGLEYLAVPADWDFSNNIVNEKSISAIIVSSLQESACPDKLMKKIAEIAELKSAPVIFAVPNISHKDIIYKLIEGRFDYTESGLISQKSAKFFCEETLQKLLSDNGFSVIANNDIISATTEQQFPKESTLVASKSLAHEYVEWLKDLVDPNASTYCFVRTCKVVAAHHSDASNEPDEPRPFLSVLTRTQGRRPEALNETILCLAGQTDTDFELLIVAHKLDKEQTELVESIIASQPEWLRKKIRLILVNYGNRTAPLNMGFSEARGQYVSVLDDDDIVFDNWVEEFHKLAIENPGKILHSFIFSQNWMTVETPAHIDALRATSSVSDIYCKKFDILSQLSINRCPTLGLAFPAYSFKHYGITFDENLSTTEDWDFLMRTVFLCGIADTEVATGIYRLWTNTENSATLHDKNEWEDNYRLIKQKFSTTVIALPKGYSEIFDSPSNANISTSFDNNFYHFEDARVYVDLGNGYNAADIVSVGQASSLDFMVECPKIAKFDAISSVRFDPTPNGCGMISDFKAVAVDIKGNETTYLIADITTNGNVYDKSIVFLKNDPQILIDLKSPQKLKNIKFDFSYSKVIPDEFIDDFAKNKFSKSLLYRILVRALGKIKRMFKK